MQWLHIKTQKGKDKNQVLREVRLGQWGDALKFFPPLISNQTEPSRRKSLFQHPCSNSERAVTERMVETWEIWKVSEQKELLGRCCRKVALQCNIASLLQVLKINSASYSLPDTVQVDSTLWYPRNISVFHGINVLLNSVLEHRDPGGSQTKSELQ